MGRGYTYRHEMRTAATAFAGRTRQRHSTRTVTPPGLHTHIYVQPTERKLGTTERELQPTPATRSHHKRPAHTVPTSSVQITLSPGVDIHRMRCQSHTCQASTNGRQRKQLHRETPRRYGLRGRQAAITLFREMQRAGGEGETHTYRAGPTWTEKCSIQANTRH